VHSVGVGSLDNQIGSIHGSVGRACVGFGCCEWMAETHEGIFKIAVCPRRVFRVKVASKWLHALALANHNPWGVACVCTKI
jgi:hypothetical protein